MSGLLAATRDMKCPNSNTNIITDFAAQKIRPCAEIGHRFDQNVPIGSSLSSSKGLCAPAEDIGKIALGFDAEANAP